MAFGNGPRIVTSGLVLALDASDKNSYPGSGTVWSDLSGNNKNGTLINSPTFNSANGGSIVTNGTNQYSDFGDLSSFINTTTITFSVWLKWSATGVNKTILGNEPNYPSQILSNPVGFGLRQRSANNYWLSLGANAPAMIDYTPTITTSNWHNVLVTLNGTTATFYINGNSVSSAACNYTVGSTISFQIGRNSVAATEYWGGNMASFQLYSRALSTIEITQNYNATKSRFNLT